KLLKYNKQKQLLLQLHNKLLHNKLLKYKLQYKSNKLLYKLLRLTTTTMYNVLTQLLYNNKELTAMLQHKSTPLDYHNLLKLKQLLATLQTHLVLKQQLKLGLQAVNPVVQTQQEMVNTLVSINYQHHTLVETTQQKTKNV